MNIVDRFEQRTRILIRDLTLEEFTRIMHDKGYSEFFEDSSKVLELIDGILKYGSDINLKKNVLTLKLILTLENSEKSILNIFEQYRSTDITREELVEKCKEWIFGNDLILSITASACSLIAIQDLQIEKDYLQNKIRETLELIASLQTDILAFTIKCRIIDLITSIREHYFELTEIDCFDSNCTEIMNKELDSIHNFESNVLKIENLKSDKKPEEFGFIDITKLKRKE